MGCALCSPRIVQATNGERNRHIHLGARLHANARHVSKPAPESDPGVRTREAGTRRPHDGCRWPASTFPRRRIAVCVGTVFSGSEKVE
jgi:hypothetical protein